MSANPRGFASDNASGAHPVVLAAISRANDGHVTAYGDDPYTRAAMDLFRRHFGETAEAFLVFNGTGANVLSLQAAARPHQAVICPETAHLAVDECGAPERIAGTKLITLPTPEGKLAPDQIAPATARLGDQHAVQPRVVSVSQATELGTVYRPEEIQDLAASAHERGMILHVDGARICNAAAGLGVDLRAITTDVGVDVLSFGGTKNGLLIGDAVVFLRPGLADDFLFIRKQSMQLASKMRFIATQFEALLEGDLWLQNASHANEMAKRLAAAVARIDGVEIAYPVEANGVFARLPRPAIGRLLEELPGEHPFYPWDEDADIVRWMCSWDTSDDDVDRLTQAVARVIDELPG